MDLGPILRRPSFRRSGRAASVAILLFFVSAPRWAAAALPSGRLGYNRDIRPILSENCFRCHGPDKGSRMAGFRLDVREQALQPIRSGAVPIVPGKPEASAVVARIFDPDPARAMPPEYAHKTLTPLQKETIRRWVAEGAEYEGHWAYLPVRRPPVPEIPAAGAPVRNPIDAFVGARLAREGLKPSPEADPITLIRRVTLDLTGLPPTPEEVRAFAADPSPEAYERTVDRLLHSPRHAETQAMHWLDAVRYADTCGFHGDNPIPAWPYRDYVLGAFRDNKPFDVFTREQLAGDLLPNATVDQKVASAYNRLNRTSAEGGLQPKEYLAKYAADRVRTASAVWLGSTMGCAECHDHKFDPFTSRDFYSMKAFFADLKETGLVPDRGAPAWGSKLRLPSPEQSARLEDLERALQAARERLDVRARRLDARRAAWERETLAAFDAGRLTWRLGRPMAAHAARGATLTVYNDEEVESASYVKGSLLPARGRGNGLVIASGANPDNEVYTVTFAPGAGTWTALGIEVVQDESLPGNRMARGADRFVLSEVEAEVARPGERAPRRLTFTLATAPQAEVPPMAAIDGDPRTGWGLPSYGELKNPFLALRFGPRLETTAEARVTVRLRFDSELRRATIGRFRLALAPAVHSWPGREAIGASEAEDPRNGLPESVVKALRTPAGSRSDDERKALDGHFRWASDELLPEYREVVRLEARIATLDAEVPRVVVSEAVEPRVTRILARANWMDDSGEVVQPAVPDFLGKLDTGGRRATRLDLANWLVSTENPLTARVLVNRLWRQFFGTGLSKSLDDLGSQGEWPSHPELLDWLAAELMRPEWRSGGTHAWDVRHVIRAIVTSHTYRQSSLGDPKLEARDPDNRLLARQSRFRVDAETVRDVALAASGLLVERFGGPSVRPYQPDGFLAALNFPKRDYSAARGADLYRRGVYTHWQRSFLHPSLAAFDAPTREECTVNRTASNTPLQALVLLNDPTFVEAARVFAARALAEGGTGLDARIDWIMERAVGRRARPEERRILEGLHGRSLERFRSAPGEAARLLAVGDAPPPDGGDRAELAALTAVTRAVLNLHETITRN
jgi:hypothetical protein